MLALAAGSVGCSQEPYPDSKRVPNAKVSEEVYRIFCERVARTAYPLEDTGDRFRAACAGPAGLAALGTSSDARLASIVQRRAELVAAMDLVFGDAPVTGSETFLKGAGDTGELDQLLKNMIPFYDDGTTPRSTRALSAMAKQLANPVDPRAQQVLQKLADLSARQGYRAPGQTLAATKPLLTYPNIDDVSERLLAILGEGGAGNAVFKKLLEATALELADDSKNVPSADSSLRVATDLLFRTLRDPAVPVAEDGAVAPFPETSATAPMFFVRRDDTGAAVGAAQGGTPFPIAGRTDDSASFRDPAGRLPGYKYGNATETVLAALLREQKPLLQRKAAGQPSTVEKLLRGVRPLLGPSTQRSYTFTSGKQYPFTGPDVSQSPLMDLVHGLSTLLAYPETESVLAVLTELLEKYESDASGTVYAAIAIKNESNLDNNAKLTGVDGTPNSPSEFWDDLIDVGMKMLEPGREGMLEAVLRSFGEPSAVAQTALLAKFMQFKDEVSYNGYPTVKPGAGGKYSDADKQTMNSEIKAQLQTLVDRAQPDLGMNRSLFQRLTNLIRVTNGAPVCNKEGAKLTVPGPLGNLTFPNADPLQMSVVGCNTPEVTIHASRGSNGYASCQFISQSNAAVTQMLSILSKGSNRPHDPQMKCAAGAVGQDASATQESESQIDGFTFSPTPEGLARFIGAPRNKFLSDLFDPLLTPDGVPLVDYERNMLFSLEPKQDDVLLNGQPTNFLEVSKDLLKAFDDNEITVDDNTTFDQPKWPKGYMFADLMGTLGKHWPSPQVSDCPATVQQGLEGCTQRLDPTKPFYAPQSNLVSYEPLLASAFQNHKLGEILYTATKRLKDVWIAPDATTGRPIAVAAGTAGAKDGISVLTDFVRFALTANPELADRRGKHETKTNACTVVTTTDPTTGQPVTACANNVGRVLPQTTPLHLVLDALSAIDTIWKDPANAERYKTFREGRSELVDTLLSVTKDATDPANPIYRMNDQRGRAVAVEALGWVRQKLLTELHPANGDRKTWAVGPNGLAKRLETTLSHPLVGYGLDLFDVVWNDPAAGDALAAMNTYLMDFQTNESAFLGIALAAADSLEFADREPNLAPVIQFGSIAVAPDALSAIAAGSSAAPAIGEGAAYTGLELTRKVALLPAYAGKPGLSPLAKILKNAAIAGQNGRAPLEVVFDASADVNRVDPALPTAVPMSPQDNQKIFDNLQSFLSDPERGLERVYTVISGRKLNSSAGTQ